MTELICNSIIQIFWIFQGIFFWKIFVPVGDDDLDDAALISFLKTKLEIKLN